jgi:hypothetical protein
LVRVATRFWFKLWSREMASNELFSREEALVGLPLRRASFLLFLIESRTARMVAHARQAAEFFPSEEVARELDLAFLEAFTLGREPPLRPTIQDLERYAPRWAHLAPQNPRLRAAIAHLLGRKYRFAREDVPGIQAALGLDEAAVQQAFRAAFKRPLESIYAPRVAWVERLRWALSSVGRRFELLPPFWITFTFMLGASFAQSVLALPIAMAGVGPLAGVVLLVLIGSSNALTTACLAEAAARSSDVRYGGAFIGRLTAAYLGSIGALLFTAAITARSAMVLLASYIGLSVTLAGFTGAPGPVWAGLLMLLILRHALRQTRKSSLSTIAVLGAANAGLVLILSVLAAAHLRAANLLYANLPFVGNHPFDLSLLSSAVGVCLMCYFGHPFVVQCAKVVLPRDPSGRALIWGNVAVMATMTVVMGLWLVAVNGALGPEQLTGQRGTALGPLAEQGSVRKMEKEGGPRYRALHAIRRGRHLPGEIWTALTGDMAKPAGGALRSRWAWAAAVARRAWEALLSERGRLAMALSPVLLVFAVAEVFLLQGFASYATVLAFCGIIVVPLATGVFPVLLLASSRRKGEIASAMSLRGFGNPLILSVVYLSAVGILFLYGLVIWQGAVERAIAIIVGVIVLAVTAVIVRRGAFAPRVVIALRDDGCARGRAVFAITASGRPAEAEVRLDYPEGERALRVAAGEVPAFPSLRSATFRLPVGPARELKVWAYRIAPGGDSEGLAAVVEVDCGVEAKPLDLKLSGGQAVLPVSGDECQVKIILADSASSMDACREGSHRAME